MSVDEDDDTAAGKLNSDFGVSVAATVVVDTAFSPNEKGAVVTGAGAGAEAGASAVPKENPPCLGAPNAYGGGAAAPVPNDGAAGVAATDGAEDAPKVKIDGTVAAEEAAGAAAALAPNVNTELAAVVVGAPTPVDAVVAGVEKTPKVEPKLGVGTAGVCAGAETGAEAAPNDLNMLMAGAVDVDKAPNIDGAAGVSAALAGSVEAERDPNVNDVVSDLS